MTRALTVWLLRVRINRLRRYEREARFAPYGSEQWRVQFGARIADEFARRRRDCERRLADLTAVRG